MSPHFLLALERLPHGPQFRFLDRLTDLDPGRTGTGEYHPRGEEPFFEGHFPGAPLMPGVLLIEAGAQLAGVVAQCDPAIPPLRSLRLAGVRTVKLTGSARPGQSIRLEATILKRLGNLIQAAVKAEIQSQVIMQGEVTLAGE
jgi:3-hydroxyacyl-[acyl-carrier-protein] dehydratase